MDLRCYKHQMEPMICFCLKKQCEIPLCIQCINQHNFFHTNQKTQPQYLDIRNSYLNIRKSMQNMINNADQKCANIVTFILKKENALVKYKESLEINLQKIKNIRRECIQIVNNYFDKCEQVLNDKFEKQLKRNGALNYEDLQKIRHQLRTDIDILNRSKQDLNQNNFHKLYPRMKLLLLSEMQQNHNKTFTLLNSNQQIQLTIELNQISITQLKQILQTVVQVTTKNYKKSSLKQSKIGKNTKHKNNKSNLQSSKQNQIKSKNVNWAYPLAKNIYTFQTSEQKLSDKPVTPHILPTTHYNHSQQHQMNVTFPSHCSYNIQHNNQTDSNHYPNISLNLSHPLPTKQNFNKGNIQHYYHYQPPILSPPLSFSKTNHRHNPLKINNNINNTDNNFQQPKRYILRNQNNYIYSRND